MSTAAARSVGSLTAKGQSTRARILEVALQMFRERGFEGTTMRQVAEDAGVSLGNAYYYFRSKEHLIQAFYDRSHQEHLAACANLDEQPGLEARLRLVVESKIDTSAPYHRFAGILFKTAADPRSPLSPFSEESRAVRTQATRLMARVVEGSEARVPPPIAAELPHLLWLYLMGVILFWVHDDSAGASRTYRLIDSTVPLVGKLVKASRVPPFRRLALQIVHLVRDLGRDLGGGSAPRAPSGSVRT